MWFERLTGFVEESPEQVRSKLSISGEYLISRQDGRRLKYGTLSVPSLADLRKESLLFPASEGSLTVSEVVADVQDLHADPENKGAMFQVASQFNLLEMIGPQVTPEHGISIYENDLTQGPACAIACGAATIYRNYFVEVNGQRGQTESNQIDCLADLGAELGNVNSSLWEMRNGYAIASESGLNEVSRRLNSGTGKYVDYLRGKLRVGIQSEAGVTLGAAEHDVSQIFCSAVPVAYSRIDASLWSLFAVLVLEAAYEATFHAAVINAARTGNKRLFLTLLGGGAFGNRMSWIVRAIERSLNLFRGCALDVRFVSYGSSQSSVHGLIEQFTHS